MNLEEKILELRSDSTINKVLEQLQTLGDSVILGGAVRDYKLGKQPRDIDIVVDCPTGKLNVLRDYEGKRNNFGGYKVVINKVEFDIWSLESTWALKNDSKFEKKLDVIPETVFFNMDAIIYYMHTGQVVDKGFSQAMESRTLDIVYEPNPYPYLCVSKALIALDKYDMKPSERLRDFIGSQEGRGYGESNFIKYQNVNYGVPLFNYKECMKRVA